MLEFPFKKLHAINYVIIALVLLAAIFLTRNIISISLSMKESQTVQARDKTTTNKIPAVKNIMSYAPIVEKNPFGPSMKFQPIATDRDTIIRMGSLSELILLGTATGPKNLSYAIFENKSQPAPVRQEVFAYGENVHGYGTLTKIEQEWVELTQGADTHIIPLIDITDIKTKNLRTHQSSASQSRLAKKINERQYLLDHRKVQGALNDTERILSDARLYPNIKNGKQEGFRILEVKPGGLYEGLGLRNRDILLKINGLELSSPEAAIQTMSALKGMNSVNLDIIRNGKKMTLGYQIR